MNKFKTIEIAYDESNVHNEIRIECNDPDLFEYYDPSKKPVLNVKIGSRTMKFLLEKREGERKAFELTGISLSVLEDAPYVEDMDFILEDNLSENENSKKASSVASMLVSNCTVEWDVFDWMVPGDFSFSGKPLDGIQLLASEIGAVVRCKDDGNLIVRYKDKNNPTKIDYTRSSILSLSYSIEEETGYNAVRVFGPLSNANTPKMEIEEIKEMDGSTRAPYKGESCYIRVYWEGNLADISIMDTYVTDGSIQSCGFTSETVTEVVDFKDGTGNVSKPIHNLISYKTIGAAIENIKYTQYSTDLFLDFDNEDHTNLFRTAYVTYTTMFQRFLLQNHNVERLIAVLFLAAASEINITVRLSNDLVYGPPIEASYLTSEAALVERGKAWLYEQYRKAVCDIDVPYDDNAIDGNIARINDAEIGENGDYRIKSSSILIEGPKVTNTLRIEKCLTSYSN